jgi:hypothetical protein
MDFKVDELVKSSRSVMPANAGIQNLLKILDPGFRRDDGQSEFRAFYESVKVIKPIFTKL